MKPEMSSQAKEELVKLEEELQRLEEERQNVKGRETEVYTRIVGYHRAVNSWNGGKKEEYKDRKTFIAKDCCE